MNVRVVGPNLHDQSKGQFHVHKDGCADLLKYGPGRRFGGDSRGEAEMLVTDATQYKVVMSVYDNGILDEAVADDEDGQSKAELAMSSLFLGDFWFAPCCKDLPATGQNVYECSTTHGDIPFVKMHAEENVEEWVKQTLPQLPQHGRITIQKHYTDEYS